LLRLPENVRPPTSPYASTRPTFCLPLPCEGIVILPVARFVRFVDELELGAEYFADQLTGWS
jgi:hypothetical protein